MPVLSSKSRDFLGSGGPEKGASPKAEIFSDRVAQRRGQVHYRRKVKTNRCNLWDPYEELTRDNWWARVALEALEDSCPLSEART